MEAKGWPTWGSYAPALSPAESAAVRIIEALRKDEGLGRWEKPWSHGAPFNPVSESRGGIITDLGSSGPRLASERPAPVLTAARLAEGILRGSGARILHDGGDRAFYAPRTDSVHLPQRTRFASPHAYYAAAIHELGHWTGGRHRVPRGVGVGGRLGSPGYAREEIRAEFAAAMVCAELGLAPPSGPELHDGEVQHAKYISWWIAVLRNDPGELFRAAGDASRICDFILGFCPTPGAVDRVGFGAALVQGPDSGPAGP